ncbi:MAG TPA: DEAD/DEAH box helicase [Mycobacteriales bacterium]|nr:DEAD/DEAH box helicase [Mycobacteriales bacterium]
MPRPNSGGAATARRRPRPSHHRRASAPGQHQARTAPPRISALEALLDEAAAQPAPAPRDFAQLGLPAPLVTTLARRGFSAPFAIQTRALPDALAGRDVLGRAQTGSGKTLAFGLAVIARLHSGDRPKPATAPRALILAPTRELANQVADELAPLAHSLDLRVAPVYGGAPMGRQIDRLRRGVDILVATPGRLQDIIEQKVATLAHIEITVLDEADHMADLGFMPAVTKLLDMTPAGGQRLLFSATLDRGVDRLAQRYLTDPAAHAVASSRAQVDTMDHRVFTVKAEDKVAVASAIAARPARSLFFVRTKHGADRLAKQLSRSGADAVAIHGNLNQNQRERALRAFTTGHSRVLVATDVAARGIHVDDVDLVVHFDPPNDHKDYLHRSGRTARAGATGTVLSLVEPTQLRDVEKLHAQAAVTTTTSRVDGIGHADVVALATSGEPIVVEGPPPAAPGAQPARRPRSATPRRGGVQHGRGRERRRA